MEEVLKIVGLGTPLLYATAVYGLFHFFDDKASDEAKSAIKGWLKPFKHDRAAVAAAILELFDWIYGVPLLSLSALRRSAVISLTLTGSFVTIYMLHEVGIEGIKARPWNFILYFLITSSFNILTDYSSLFLVRRCLQIEWGSRLLIMIMGAVAGFVVILFFFVIRALVTAAVVIYGLHLEIPPATIREYAMSIFDMTWEQFQVLGITPALATHVWLLLFPAAALILKAARYFTWSTEKMQWFIKQGNEHPLDAMGYVAALIVFVSTTAISVLGRALS